MAVFFRIRNPSPYGICVLHRNRRLHGNRDGFRYLPVRTAHYGLSARSVLAGNLSGRLSGKRERKSRRLLPCGDVPSDPVLLAKQCFFRVEDIDVEMIKSTFDFHILFFLYKLKISAFSGIGQQDITKSLRFGIRTECYYFGRDVSQKCIGTKTSVFIRSTNCSAPRIKICSWIDRKHGEMQMSDLP